MQQSEQINELAKALASAQKDFKPVIKNRTAKVPTKSGKEYSYTYADLSDCVAAISEALHKAEIAWVQSVTEGAMVTRLLHSSGQWLENSVPMVEAQGYGPQALGSQFTYFRRYGLCQAVGLVAEEDDDGNARQNATKTETKTKKAAPPRSDANERGEAPAPEDIRDFWIVARKNNWSEEDVREQLTFIGLESTKQLNWSQYDHLIGNIRKFPKKLQLKGKESTQ